MSKSNPESDIEAATGGDPILRRQYDWGDIEPSTAIATLLTEATDQTVRDLDPLYNTIDSDALDSLFQSKQGRPDCTVSFSYGEFSVRVRGDGEVALFGPAFTPGQ